MMRFAIPITIAPAASSPPALAYTCTLSPAKDAVIVKTDNASDRARTCKVDCTFRGPDGPVTISCSQQIPAAEGWYVCCSRLAATRWSFPAAARAADSAD